MEFTILIDLGLMVVAAALFGYIARLLKQPSLLAYIIAGVVIGPLGLGAINLFFGNVQFGISNIDDIRIFSEFGIAILLFSIGVETDFRKFLSIGKVAAIGATIQVAVTVAIVMLFNFFFNIMTFEQSIIIGVILAFSSTMVVIKLLGDNYQINTLHGRLLIGFLLMQDFLVILAIPMLKDIGSALALDFLALIFLKIIVMIAAAIIISRYILPRIFSFSLKYQEEFFLAALSSCFIFITLAVMMDMPMAIGAFIGGLALSTLPYNTEIFNKIRGVRDLFVTIFFVSLGMQLSFGFAAIPIVFILFIIALVLFLKPVMYYAITLFSGYGTKVSLMVALALANVSEFSLIIAQMAYEPGNPASILTSGQFSVIILTISLSMIITPYLMLSYGSINSAFMKASVKIPKKFKRKRFSAKLVGLEMAPKRLNDHIVVIGGGTMGSNIAKALYKHFPTVVIDQDSEVVYSCIRQGINAYYGDADEEDVLKKANPGKAKLVVIAIPNIKASLKVLNYVKRKNPKTPVFARAHYYRDTLKLYKEGADFVCMPHVIGGNIFLKNIGKFLDSGKLSKVVNLQYEFMHYLEEKAVEEQQHFGV